MLVNLGLVALTQLQQAMRKPRLSTATAFLPSLLISHLAASGHALCVQEPAFAPFPGPSRACYVSPNETANLELYLVFRGACEQHATWYQSVVYWGVDGGRSTASALDTYVLPTGTTSGTMTFRFPVPATALAPGRMAVAAGYGQDNENWRRLDWYVGWTHELVTTVVVVPELETAPAFATVLVRNWSFYSSET